MRESWESICWKENSYRKTAAKEEGRKGKKEEAREGKKSGKHEQN